MQCSQDFIFALRDIETFYKRVYEQTFFIFSFANVSILYAQNIYIFLADIRVEVIVVDLGDTNE